MLNFINAREQDGLGFMSTLDFLRGVLSQWFPPIVQKSPHQVLWRLLIVANDQDQWCVSCMAN